jgi:phospholipid-binding lipoprotein MlaA
LAGCASSGSKTDPYESTNRAIYKFNRGLDKAVLLPVAETYTDIAPDFVQDGASNFFSNINDVGIFINNVLQFKLVDASSDLGRILINTTVGLGGLFDPASAMGLQKHDEDFGQTLAAWGFESGPYIMLPLLGPTTGRDIFGIPADNYFDPFTEIRDDTTEFTLKSGRLLLQRASLLDFESQLQAAVDEYALVRDAYLQNRKFKVYDGDIPLEDEFDCDPEYEECDEDEDDF